MLDILPETPLALGVSMGLVALMAACSLRRWSAWALAGALAAACAAWVFALGGAQTLTEMGSALLLRAEGFRAAVPFVARETALTLAALSALLGFALTREKAGMVPALMGLILVLLILWLSGMERALPCTAPGVAAVLLLIIRERHGSGVPGRAWPVVAVLTALTFLLSPFGALPSTPVKESADALRQRILDLFFFTQPRNVFSLADEGFYPQGGGQMGGPAAPTDHPVMTVQTPRTAYLRGSVRNTYTGRDWRDTTGGRRYLWVSPRWRSLREGLFDAALPAGSLTENTLLTPSAVSVEMAAANVSSLFTPQRVRQLTVGGDLVPYFNNATEVFVTRDQRAGDSYTVSAPLAVGGDSGLEAILAACEHQAEAPDDAFLNLYTALPGHLQEQVYTLARQAVQGQTTAYGKALAIRDWLRASFRYTLDAPWQPEDADFVTYFLLTTGEGYCVHFASAMTVLCRMAGLPARYVEGYLAQPGADGVAYVTGLDAHAWTEVFFPGYGWLTFDATPPQTSPEEAAGHPDEPEDSSGEPEGEEPPPPETPDGTDDPGETPPPTDGESGDTPTPTPAPTATPEPQPSPDSTDGDDDADSPGGGSSPEETPQPGADSRTSPWLWVLLALLLAAALVALRLRLTSPARLAAKAGDSAWFVWFTALAQMLTAAGLPREKHETPAAWLSRADASGLFGPSLSPLGETASAVLYGHMPPTGAETAAAADICRQVWSGLNRRQKLRLLLRRLRHGLPQAR